MDLQNKVQQKRYRCPAVTGDPKRFIGKFFEYL